jgi:D-alanyl-D-alanine carboxypeptidase
MIARLALAAVALLSVSAPALAQSLTPAETARVDRIVGDALAKSGTPSASIALVRGGRLVFAKAYGKASEAIPVASVDLPYQIASNSKQFTAAAVLLLQRDGKLSLDDTVAKYLPGISGGDRITLRQLLSHTAGLQDYWPQDYSFADMARPITPQQILDRWARKPLDFAPGTQWQYSNTGYVVAGLIVEKVAGEPLLAFLHRRIFAPLGMTPIDQDLATGPHYPQGYQRFALGPVRVERPAARGWLFAAGELAMTASDLARWDIARMNRTLLSPVDWAMQETPVTLADGTTNGYGLGVQTGSLNGHKLVSHGGEAVGFLSQNSVLPDDKAAVVVLTNGDFGDAYQAITAGLLDIAVPAPASAPASMTPDAAALTRARGVYDSLLAGTLDRTLLTDDANYYFTATALADYRRSLAPLGQPTGFTALAPAKLRGGFVNRNYKVSYPDRTLTVVTYAEAGDAGRFEQFLVMPAN